ncbi:MAG TPA: hypothetical protein DCQ31_01460 [Bacteroidales bacterium]|nr:hypothetical protein [Bacteroidales bacterium]
MDDLRKKADEILRNSKTDNLELSKLELNRLFEEINIHQIELKIQNQELRERNQEIEEAKSKYFSLFNFAPLGYIVIDDKAIIRDCNIKASEIFQRRKDYIIDHTFISFVEITNMSGFYEALALAKNDQIKDKFEIMLRIANQFLYFESSINKYSNGL